jgi:putative tricarboxylic transport membrane protein
LKSNDALAGALLLALALAILFHIRAFPTIPGQNIGPAAFPGLLATLLAACSIALIVRGLRARTGSRSREGAVPWIAIQAWVSSPAQLRNFVLTVGVLLFMKWGIERLGFIVCGMIMLMVLFSGLRLRPRVCLPLAVGVTLVIHTLFYKFLRVPLPWGLLEGMAW